MVALSAPKDGERNPDETAPDEDVAAIAALDPPPEKSRTPVNASSGRNSAPPTHYGHGATKPAVAS